MRFLRHFAIQCDTVRYSAIQILYMYSMEDIIANNMERRIEKMFALFHTFLDELGNDMDELRKNQNELGKKLDKALERVDRERQEYAKIRMFRREWSSLLKIDIS
jgi:adenylosuccinate lyase